MEFDSIIFDLDGTLWNVIPVAKVGWETVLKRYPNIKKVVTSTDIEKNMGVQINEIGKILFPDLDGKLQIKLMKEFSEALQIYLKEHGGILFNKLEETLKILSKKHKLFIVSNCFDGYIQCFLKIHKLEAYFADFECSGVMGIPKGENNKIIIKRNNLKSPIYVGDTIVDADSAKVANIPFIFARYGFGNVEEYDYVIDSFEEILTLGL